MGQIIHTVHRVIHISGRFLRYFVQAFHIIHNDLFSHPPQNTFLKKAKTGIKPTFAADKRSNYPMHLSLQIRPAVYAAYTE
jgi:hypothetical protein